MPRARVSRGSSIGRAGEKCASAVPRCSRSSCSHARAATPRVQTRRRPFPNGNTYQCSVPEADPASLACVHGLAFADGYLYYTRSDELRRFAYLSGDRAPRGASELVATLGGAGIDDVRWTHTIDRRADG